MLTKDQESILRKQLKAGTPPIVAGAMLGAKTIQEFEDNKRTAYEFAKKEKLLKPIDSWEPGDK